LSALSKIANAVTSHKTEKKRGAWWRWPLIIVLVLFGFAIMAWVLGRNRRELARLRHEKNKREILAANAKTLAAVGVEEETAETRLQAANESLKRVEEINQKIREAEKRYEENRHHASRITWADLPAGGGG
jgi:hypothetical protein